MAIPTHPPRILPALKGFCALAHFALESVAQIHSIDSHHEKTKSWWDAKKPTNTPPSHLQKESQNLVHGKSNRREERKYPLFSWPLIVIIRFPPYPRFTIFFVDLSYTWRFWFKNSHTHKEQYCYFNLHSIYVIVHTCEILAFQTKRILETWLIKKGRGGGWITDPRNPGSF